MTGAGRIGATRSNVVSFLMMLVLAVGGCNRPLPQTADSGAGGGPPAADSGVLVADSGPPAGDSGAPTADSGPPVGDSGQPIADGGSPTPDAGAGWTAPPRCALPFDVGPCDAVVRVFAFVGGACVERVYGGCAGNDNRFRTLEECMATCEGRPVPNGCPAPRVPGPICLACGDVGGCVRELDACVLGCDPALTICTPGTACLRGSCQMPCR
jgi:hypothetical protein